MRPTVRPCRGAHGHEGGVEGDGEDVAVPHRDRMPADLGEHLHLGPGLLHPRGSDEDGADRLVSETLDDEILLEALQLAAEGVTAAEIVREREMVAVTDDHPSAAAQDRAGGLVKLANRPVEAFAGESHRDRGGLAPGNHQTVEALELGGGAHLTGLGTERGEHSAVGLEVALDRQDAHLQGRLLHLASGAGAVVGAAQEPRPCSRPPSAASASISRPGIASPSSIEACATRSGSLKCVVASTIARARRAGSSLLKMPEPTKLPSAPSCIISAASAGVAMPPAQKRGTGSQPRSATSWTTSSGAWCCFAAEASCSPRSEASLLIPSVISRMWRTASTMLPVPASPLERIIAAPSPIRRSPSPRLVAPQTKGTSKANLSMWFASSAGVSTSDSST